MLLVISENLGQSDDGALNMQITPHSWSLACIHPACVPCADPCCRGSAPKGSHPLAPGVTDTFCETRVWNCGKDEN